MKHPVSAGQAAYQAFGGSCPWFRLSAVQQDAWHRAAAAAAQVASADEIAKSAQLAKRAADLEAEIDEANEMVSQLSAARDTLESQLTIERQKTALLSATSNVLQARIAQALMALNEIDAAVEQVAVASPD